VTVVDRLNRVKCLSGEASSQVYVMSLCGKFNPKLFLRKSLIKHLNEIKELCVALQKLILGVIEKRTVEFENDVK
jgi:hypothetical protein